MRKYSVIALIFILFFSFLYNDTAAGVRSIASDTLGDGELLLLAMEQEGFEGEEYNINTSMYIEDKFLSIEELWDIQEELLDILKLDGKIETVNMDNEDVLHGNYFEDLSELEENMILVQKTEDDDYNQLLTIASSEGLGVTVLKLLSTQIEDEMETHILVDIVHNKGYKEIVGKSNQIKDTFKKYGNNVETTINLTGVLEGKLTKQEEKQKQENMLGYLGAKKMEVLEDELFTSITAYSPLITSFIQYGGKKVNLQLATRYNEYENKTYCWISNPLITTAY